MQNDYIRRDKSLLAYLSAEAYAQLQRVPAADVVEVRHGWWIPDKDLDYCSECGCEKLARKRQNYCPHCGAKMDGGVNNGQQEKNI